MKNILLFLLMLPCFVFAQTTDATLTTQAQQIRTETTPGANTANRVGTHLQNLVYSKKSFFIDGTASGTNTYSVTLDNGAVTALTSQWFLIKFTNANSGASTLNINAIGAKDLVKTDGTALSSGDIDAGSVHLLSYDGTDLQVLSIGASGGGGSVSSVSGTTNRITSTGGTTPVIDISATFEALLSKVAQRIDQNNAATTSAQLATTLSDESGTGVVAYTTNPAFTTPNLGTPSAVTLTNGTGLPGTAVINTPSGTIAATTAQAAINELNSEKANILISFRRLTASHTLDATDLSSVNTGQRVMIEMNSGSANDLTVPLNATQAFPIGSVIDIKQYGGGVTSIVATGGVTLRSTSGVLTIGNQFSGARLIKVDTNEWYLENGNPAVLSGTWTPTLTNTTNIAASTAYLSSYSRVGNRVTFSGRVDIDPTATGSVVMGISLPVTSAFTQAYEAGGAAFSPGIAGQGAAVLSDATNDRLTLQYIAVDVSNQAFYFSGGYEVK